MPAGDRKGVFSSIVLALDGMPTPVAAYGLHRLRREYSGHLIRVRRNSDNAEQNFGENSAEINISEIQNWVGSGNTGFVKQWFDQSGNERILTALNTAVEPRIISAGSLVLLNDGGKPAIDFLSNRGLQGFYDFDFNTAIAACRSTTTTFANYHSPLGTFSAEPISVGLRRFCIFELGSEGVHSNPFPSAMWRNGQSRAVNATNTLQPINSAFIATIQNNRPNKNFLQIGNFDSSNTGGACLQSCAIGFPAPLSESDRQTIEQRLMGYYGIT